MDLDSVRQVCEKKPFGMRNVYYYCYDLILAMLHNGYFYCTCKYSYWEDGNPTLIGKKCHSCQIGDNFANDEHENIKKFLSQATLVL